MFFLILSLKLPSHNCNPTSEVCLWAIKTGRTASLHAFWSPEQRRSSRMPGLRLPCGSLKPGMRDWQSQVSAAATRNLAWPFRQYKAPGASHLTRTPLPGMTISWTPPHFCLENTTNLSKPSSTISSRKPLLILQKGWCISLPLGSHWT